MLKKMKLAAKLYSSFAVVLALLITVGTVGYRSMTTVAKQADNKGDADSVAQMFLKIRVYQRDYQLRHDEESLKDLNEGITHIREKLKNSSSKFVLQNDIAQFSKVATSIKGYHESFLTNVELFRNRDVLMQEIQITENSILKTVDQFAANQERQLAKQQQDGASENYINDRIEKILDVDSIIRLFLDARKNEKDFIITNGANECLDKVDSDILDIKKVATNLKSRSSTQNNIDFLDTIIAGVSKYNQEFEEYAQLMSKQKEALDNMETLSENLEKDVETVSTEQKQKMQAQISSVTLLLVTVSAVALIVCIFCSITVTRGITGPIAKTMMLAEKMARGDFTARIEIKQRDEIGVMARSLNAMAEQLGTMIKEIVVGVKSLSESSADMTVVSKQLSFSSQSTAEKLTSVASAAEEMSSNFQSVSTAIEQSSNNFQVVATATEEMTATINEIRQKAARSRIITENAVEHSKITSDKMSAFGEAAKKIGRVTETITAISEQTNLLALNATIEAARAGDAGKGFAVVANEIKELAKQTAISTVDIKQQIGEMQITTSSMVVDISDISDIVCEINDMIKSVAKAVEEQSAATSEIAKNITQAAQGISEVNENVAQNTLVVANITQDIAMINQESGQVGDGGSQAYESAQTLSALAIQLERLVKKFRV